MTARYGDRTRVSSPVGSWGKEAEAGGVPQPYEEVFTAPGTWTWPGTVSGVEVTVVGGGGGGQSTTPTVGSAAGGGGGGVRRVLIPVSAPVPVTVGAGGAAGTLSPTTASPGSAGGTSAFGPLGPGPIPSIPPTTVAVGGGGGGGNNTGAPPIGGGGGGAAASPGPVGNAPSSGLYGFPGSGNAPFPGWAGGGLGGGAGSAGFLSAVTTIITFAGRGRFGYGGGGDAQRSGLTFKLVRDGGGVNSTPTGSNTVHPGGLAANGFANTGGGGAGGSIPTGGNLQGGNGGSGIVIVRWFE